MKHITKLLYADILREEGQVCFWTNGYFFVIDEHSEGGWNVDVYTNEDGGFLSDDNHGLTFVDGGHCESDKPIDAIEFMLDITEAV